MSNFYSEKKLITIDAHTLDQKGNWTSIESFSGYDTAS